MSLTPQINTQDLANLVRNWVHYDNLASSLSKQTTNSRRVRDDYEATILKLLQASNLENAIIQIAGGRLVVSEEKHSTPLSVSRLTELLHGYYAEKGGVDETPAILKHIKAARAADVNVKKCLKKQAAVPPLPPPPPPGGTPQSKN